MLTFVSKKHYWTIEESGALAPFRARDRACGLPFGRRRTRPRDRLAPGELKHVQDAIALDLLRLSEGRRIAEIGGGDSRVLPAIAQANRCVNIEPFEGAGNGLREKLALPGVETIGVMIGDFAPDLAPASFDIVYSISVVEHVPGDRLDDFFRDCARILKPGGLMFHLIDMYLADTPGLVKGNAPRLRKYRAALAGPLFTPLDSSQVLEEPDPLFRTSYATNADDVLRIWNRGGSPELKALREAAQSCSLLLQAVRTDAPLASSHGA